MKIYQLNSFLTGNILPEGRDILSFLYKNVYWKLNRMQYDQQMKKKL